MSRRASFKLTAPPRALENDIESACITLLGLRGYRHERLHSGRFRSLDCGRVITGAPKGTPDYIVIHPRFPGFYLEVKRPGGCLSPEQIYKAVELREGWRLAVAVVDSSAQLAAWLDEHELQTRRQWHEYATSNRAS